MTSTAHREQVMLPGQASAPPGPVDLAGMFLMHHAFRRDLARFEACARRLPASDHEAYAALTPRWQLFVTALHHHHGGEDAGLWPLLRRRVHPTQLRTIDAMAVEHETLESLLHQCSGWVRRLAGGGADRDRESLQARLTSLRILLAHHLDHEESEAFVLVQRYLTQEEWNTVEERYFHRTLTRADVVALVPWAMHGLPDELARRVLASSPASFRLAWRLTRRRFERAEEAAFGDAATVVPLTYPTRMSA
jgi:hypothetical protein